MAGSNQINSFNIKKPSLGERIRKNKHAYLYVLPSTLIVIVISLIPILYGISLAFMNANLYTTANGTVRFVGLSNFIKILSGVDKEFLEVLLRTFIWTVINIFAHVSLGLLLALLLNKQGLMGKKIYRSLLILPWAVPQLITTLVWKIMFNYDFGMINSILTQLGFKKIGWLVDPKMAFISVIIVNIWLGFPFMLMVATGALQSIPEDFYEAADIDGASWWDKFRYITMPSIRPAMVPATTLGVIWTFNNFNVVYMITGGGPLNKTQLIQTYTYNQMISHQYSKAATYGLIVFFILLIFSYMNTKLSKVFVEEVR